MKPSMRRARKRLPMVPSTGGPERGNWICAPGTSSSRWSAESAVPWVAFGAYATKMMSQMKLIVQRNAPRAVAMVHSVFVCCDACMAAAVFPCIW